MTSDNYFFNNKNNLFDLIFLDGLHTYEQTIKDIFNSLKTLKKNGVIIVHDCLPKKSGIKLYLECMDTGTETYGKQ